MCLYETSQVICVPVPLCLDGDRLLAGSGTGQVAGRND